MQSTDRLYPGLQSPPEVPKHDQAEKWEPIYPARIPRRSRHATLAAGPIEVSLQPSIDFIQGFQTEGVSPSYLRRRVASRQSPSAQIQANPENFVPREWKANYPIRHRRIRQTFYLQPSDISAYFTPAPAVESITIDKWEISQPIIRRKVLLAWRYGTVEANELLDMTVTPVVSVGTLNPRWRRRRRS